MKNEYSKLKNNWIHLLTIYVIGFICISLFLYFSGIYHSNKAFKQYGKFVEDRFKNNVKLEVLNRIDEIDYDLSQITQKENLVTRQKINFLKDILLNSEITKIKDFKTRRKTAILKLEEFIKRDSDYLYFIMDSSANILKSGTHDNMVGSNLYNLSDKNGFFFTREIVKAVNIPEGVYVTYFWPKKKDGIPLKKTAFALYLPEFDFIIGTGSYEEDVYEQLKKSTFERIKSYYKNKINYISIVDYDGKIKVHSNQELIGENTYLLEQNDYTNIHTAIIKKLESGSGFISYNSDAIQRQFYVHPIEQWNTYIAMGFNSEYISKEIALNNTISKKEHLTEALIVLFLLSIIAFISYLYIQKGLKIQKEILEQDDIIFKKLFNLTNAGIIIVSKNKEILYKNNLIDLIFKTSFNEIFTSDTEDTFSFIEKTTYLFINKDGREYFLDMHLEKFFYLGQDCKIFIIKNISEQYIRTNELQQMAYYDQLTGLPNRRMLNNDFEDLLLHDLDKEKNTVLVLIDLDRFKNVNDKYGHDIGDKVLIDLGKIIKSNLRKTEQIYRFGGEEFIILFKQIDTVKVKIILNELNNKIENHMLEKFGFSLTFSAGATCIDSKETNLEYYIKKADILLYQAKTNGRRRIEIALENEDQQNS